MPMRLLTFTLLAVGLAGLTSCRTASEGETPTSGEGTSPVIATAAYGTVRGPDNNAVADVMVEAQGLDGQAVPELAVVTNHDGEFEWPLAPGHYRLRADTGNAEVAVDVTIIEGQRTRVDLALP